MVFGNKIYFSSLFAILLLPFAHGETDKNISQEVFDTNHCGSIAKKQSDYSGTRNFTRSGYQCQKWSEQTPHSHNITVLNYPNHSLGEHNFCRNPDNGPEAWCFTMENEVRWESCDIKNCETEWDWSEMYDAKKKIREEIEKTKQEIDEYFDDVKNLDVLCQMFTTDFKTNPCEKEFLPVEKKYNQTRFESGWERVVEALDHTVPKQQTGLMLGHVRGVAVEKNERVMPASLDADTRNNICRVQTDGRPSTADSLFLKTIRVLIADPDYNETAYNSSLNVFNHFNYCTQNMLAFELIHYNISEDLSGLSWKEATFAVLQAAKEKGILIDNVFTPNFNMTKLLTMVVLPDSIDMDEAYGFAILHNGLSIIKAEQAKMPGAVLHEIGHSLGMRHSLLTDGETRDDACIMGEAWNKTVCFNGAKSAYLGLYREYTTYINPLDDQCDAILTIVDVHTHLNKAKDLFDTCGKYSVIIVVPYHESQKSLHLMYSKDQKMLLATDGMVEKFTAGTSLHEVQIASGSQRVFDLHVEQTEKHNGILYKLCETSDDSIARVMISHDITAKLECPSVDPQSVFRPPTQAPTRAPTPPPTDAPSLDPTDAPSQHPTEVPSLTPTEVPTLTHTISPTEVPTLTPTEAPTETHTISPTEVPSLAPTLVPTSTPTHFPFERITNDNKIAARDLWFSNKQAAEDKYGPISKWDVSRVTNFHKFFYNKRSFNEDLSGWDVGRVTDMLNMFNNAHAFNRDLSGWNVGSVTNMSSMFYYARAFNQDLSGWDVGRVTSMLCMFCDARAFNQDLSGWDVGRVMVMKFMFYKATALRQRLCWSIPGNCNTGHMFLRSPGSVGC